MNKLQQQLFGEESPAWKAFSQEQQRAIQQLFSQLMEQQLTSSNRQQSPTKESNDV